MNIQYIIAGNHSQYMNWLFKQKKWLYNQDNIHCQYVGGPDILRGIRDPHGVFIGTWYERKDIDDILMQLVAASRVDNPALRKAIDYYEDKRYERTN
jgi:hypothetical protein